MEGIQGPYSSTWPIVVDVEPFTLPSTSSLPTLYRRAGFQICAAHGVTGTGCDNLLVKYLQFTLDHRLSVDPDQFPDSAFLSRHAHYMNGTTSPPTDPKGSPRLWNATPRTTAAYTNRGNQADLPSWMDQHRTAGWLDRALMYWCDEPQGGLFCPDWPNKVVTSTAVAHAGTPWLRQLVTTDHQVAVDALGTSYADHIDIVTPNIIRIQGPGLFTFPTSTLLQYSPYLAPGSLRSLWWYQSNNTAQIARYPQYGIDVAGVKNRAMPWLTFEMAPARAGLGVRGELYYATTLSYSGTTWRITADDLWQFGQNGDGTLMYPGRDRPLPSLRLKMIRDGMEDYEYLQLLANIPFVGSSTGIDCARSIARTLFQHGQDIIPERAQGLKEQRAIVASLIRSPAQPCALVSW
jgi:hypothetical protein